MSVSFKLADLVRFFPDINYKPKRFNGAILKLPKPCLLIYNNGKVNVVGARSINDACLAMENFCGALNLPCDYIYKEVVNVVATGTLNKRINLLKLCNVCKDSFTYYPELYPAAYFTDTNKKCLIFHTGKIIITGCKTYKETLQVFDQLKLILCFSGFI